MNGQLAPVIKHLRKRSVNFCLEDSRAHLDPFPEFSTFSLLESADVFMIKWAKLKKKRENMKLCIIHKKHKNIGISIKTEKVINMHKSVLYHDSHNINNMHKLYIKYRA